MSKHRKIILIADDSPDNIAMLKHILVSDYELQVASNGKMCLELASAIKPDLILLDIIMPDIDGYRVCQQLKQATATQNIPIIIITAKTSIQDELRGLQLGAFDYISKPISPPLLKARVQHCFDRVDMQATLQQKNQALEHALKIREDIEHISRHDLKSPLGSIISAIQVIQDDDNLDQEQREILGMAEKTAYKMLEMINRSLDLIKMETKTYYPKVQHIDLVPVLTRVLQELKDSIIAKQLTIEWLINRQAQTVTKFMILAEELLCYSLFSNLIKNAIEASPPKKSITINLLPPLPNTQSHSTIEIYNYGHVPKSIQQTFFDKYVTLNKEKGLGLGTYSAKLITHTLGGEIKLDSTIPDQTKLIVHLPNINSPSNHKTTDSNPSHLNSASNVNIEYNI